MKKLICIITVVLLLFVGVNSVYAENEATTNRVSCGNVTGIPAKVPQITRDVVFIIQVAIPVILVVVGAIDLVKATTAGKEDEIKKFQNVFIKRLITAAIVFFLIAGVKFLISIVDNATNSSNIVNCIDCFLVDKTYCK